VQFALQKKEQQQALVDAVSKSLKVVEQRRKQLNAISIRLPSELALLKGLQKSAAQHVSVAHVIVTESNG
jgi:mevalonate kinase